MAVIQLASANPGQTADRRGQRFKAAKPQPGFESRDKAASVRGSPPCPAPPRKRQPTSPAPRPPTSAYSCSSPENPGDHRGWQQALSRRASFLLLWHRGVSMFTGTRTNRENRHACSSKTAACYRGC
jgi:hypothetical protein